MPDSRRLNDRLSELARQFLNGLFMALRTARMHDQSNKAFENAVAHVYEAAGTLYKATGGFRVQFVDDAVFVNGSRIRLPSTAFTAMRTLKAYLEEQKIGGISMSAPPSFESIKNLIVGLASKDDDVRETALGSGGLELLGIQTLADDEEEVRIDRRVLAVQSYGKLILAMRDLLEHAERGGTELPQSRIRAVRVIQDLIDLTTDRADFILRLSENRQGLPPEELHGVNVTLLSIALGTAIGLDRKNLVDLGVTAMFHHVACRRHRFGGQIRLGQDVTLASLGHLMYQSGAGEAGFVRGAILAEHRLRNRDLTAPSAPRPSVPARILGLAVAYDQLVSGFGTRHESPSHPLEALRLMVDGASGRFDVELVDLLVNILRAFPEGAEVVLDDKWHAVVESHRGSSRWDRPIVRLVGTRERIDLMERRGDRYLRRILGTPRYLGRPARASEGLTPPPPVDPHAPPPEPESVERRVAADDIMRAFLEDAEAEE